MKCGLSNNFGRGGGEGEITDKNCDWCSKTFARHFTFEFNVVSEWSITVYKHCQMKD